MKQEYRACKKCKILTTEKTCPVHANEKTTTEWYGFIIIIDPARSEIAKRANIVEPGAYAIRVRQ